MQSPVAWILAEGLASVKGISIEKMHVHVYMCTYLYVCIVWTVYVIINCVYLIVRVQHLGTYFLLRNGHGSQAAVES